MIVWMSSCISRRLAQSEPAAPPGPRARLVAPPAAAEVSDYLLGIETYLPPDSILNR
jgi:hypothetical protein